ncbi:MAG: AEC family transporter [Ruminococcaceae bacterium]|nr:AEC family transporter [Oscillospiraceae bacterium]
MLENFLTVGTQVLVLFLLIGVGVVCTKAKLLSAAAVRCMADVVLYFATPCVIIRSFQRPLTAALMKDLGVAALAAVGVHLLGIALAHLLCRDKEESRRAVLRFGVVFSNAGYMAIPLQQAILGDDGVFFGAVFVAVFNIVLWTYGVGVMSGGVKALSLRKVLLNPGLIGVTLGLFFLLGGITLPTVIASPVSHLANLNTPVPMLIIGYYLAGANIKEALRDRSAYLTIALRLALIPLITLGVLWVCGIRGTVLVSAVIGASAPVATATTMFAAKFDRSPTLSVNLVVLSTLLSAVTMPLIVGLASLIGG